MTALCGICKGSGGILAVRPLTLWTCVYCGGSGVRVQFGPRLLTRSVTIRDEGIDG